MAKKVRQVPSRSGAPREGMKDRLISELVAARKNILDKVEGLTRAQQNHLFLGEWSVKELLAHLIGWDYTYIAAVQELEAGELPSFYAAYDADWQSYNLNLVRQYVRDDASELVVAARESHNQLASYLQTLPDEDFGMDRGVTYGGTPVTIGRLIEAEAKDEREHYSQIKAWAG